jgi:tetratricopeptide (TPR) repeat protein
LEVEELETALERRSKAEIIALVRRMVTRYPDLEALLELPVVGETGTPPPVDAEVIRRQASTAFQGLGYDDWGAAYGIAGQLLELVEIGDDYAGQGSWRDAATIYQTVMQEVLDNYGMIHDEEGELHQVVDGCIEGLGECLKATSEPVQREGLLRALFDVYRWDVDFGGIDMGYQAPVVILEQATLDEKRRVARWVREVLPAGDSWSANYHRQIYGGFLLNLEWESLDDEAFLRICRETGRQQDLVDRLLALGRVDEAVAEAQGAGDYDLLRLADLFVSHGQADLAERLIRERAPTSQDNRLTVWLKERALERGDREEALALLERLFWQRPALQGYQELRTLARQLGRWEELQAALLARLADEGQHILLTEIHLEEEEVDRALEALEKVQASRWGWGGGQLAIHVARAAEENRPREAIRIYVERAERLIAARGRGNYAEAAQYLVRVRDLYRRLGEQGTWRAFVADLREENRRLRALKDELNKAGL